MKEIPHQEKTVEETQVSQDSYLHSKYAPKESDYVGHVMTLTVETIRSIASLRFNVDISTKDVLIEMIQIAINILQPDFITPKILG